MLQLTCFLPSTNDQTDRTGDIAHMLQTQGACLLGPGLYVVSGLDMPDCTTLTGMGGATTLLLPEDLSSGYVVKLGSFCTIKDLSLTGAQGEMERPTQVGERHGILFEGTATTPNIRSNQPHNCIVSGCFIQNFSGGGITCRDTGYRTTCSIIASHCHILNCGAGINISHFSEYHKFDSILSEKNCYGCINNGGNNVFANCGFNSNTTGILMDNSQGQSPNNSHGSAVGCTINHTNANEGIGVLAIGMNSGFMFSGCQIFYSKIHLENCKGFIFDTTNYGKKVDIFVKGGGLTMFSNSSFHPTGVNSVQVIDNDSVKFINCFTRDGAPLDV